MTDAHDSTAVVIGAGPAGCAVAIGLARTGVSVTLVEKKDFPRVKVCGEYISPAGTESLERVVSPEELIAAGGRRVNSMALELGDRVIEWRTPRPAWCLSRKSLDELLRDRARAAGVEVRQPVSVRDVEYADDGVSVRTDCGAIAADFVVHADGSGRFDPAGPTPMAAGVVGVKCHYRAAEPVVGVRMRACAGGYVGTVGVEGGLATCAAVVRTDAIKRSTGNIDAAVRTLWPGWDAGSRESEWLSCGVARTVYQEPGHARSVRIGNAAAAVDPVGGEGIGLALWSAARFIDGFDGAVVSAKRSLAAAYRRRLRVRRWACWGAAEALMRPGLVRAVWPVLGRRGEGSAAMGAWYRLSGKMG
ncbi:MAG: NAD(P)/FAD-dependent oxidoreductase [Planctomycetota bacterium]